MAPWQPLTPIIKHCKELQTSIMGLSDSKMLSQDHVATWVSLKRFLLTWKWNEVQGQKARFCYTVCAMLCTSRSLLNQTRHPDQHFKSSTPGALRKLETLLSSISAQVIWWGWHCPVCIELHLHPWKGCWGPRAELQPPADPSLSTQLLEPPSGLGSAPEPTGRWGNTGAALQAAGNTRHTPKGQQELTGCHNRGAHAAPFLVSHLKCTFGKMARHYKYWALFGKSNLNWKNLLLFL